MSLPRRQGFTLIESLCMIVTLLIFGWLCVGVARYYMKQEAAPKPKIKFAAEEHLAAETKNEDKNKRTEVEPEKPWTKLVPQDAPKPAPAPVKP